MYNVFMLKEIILIALGIFIVIFLSFLAFTGFKDARKNSSSGGGLFNFQPVVSTPSSGGGQKEEIEKKNIPDEALEMLRISLDEGDRIANGEIIRGLAWGPWYFEGEFAVRAMTEGGKLLATFSARATEDWMVEDFVPFEARFLVKGLGGESKGFLIFDRANPSGLPQNNMSVKVPVLFELEPLPCVISGCSDQICADEGAVTTCEYREAYACYRRHSECRRQTNGVCGWTQTEELKTCISTAGGL